MPHDSNRRSGSARRRPPTFERLEDRSLLAGNIFAVTGDFDGDGTDTVALVDIAGQQVTVNQENSNGSPTQSYRWREISSTTVPIAGDWDGDGTDTLGLYDTATGEFVLRVSPGEATTRIRLQITNAPLDSQPLAGDWDGDGADEVALWDGSNRQLYTVNNLVTGPATQTFSFAPGAIGQVLPADVEIVAGNFLAYGGDEVALISASTDTMLIRSLNPDVIRTTSDFFSPLLSGIEFESTLAGDWDHDGVDELGKFDVDEQVVVTADSINAPLPGNIFVAISEPVSPQASLSPQKTTLDNSPHITKSDVTQILQRASQASKSNEAIIVIVDRSGKILGVRIEAGVNPNIKKNKFLRTFAIDGAVAKARTAAFFSSNAAPLTSRTIRNLSQTTISEREVNSNPTVQNPNGPNPFTTTGAVSRAYGPGFVAPIGVGGHFPAGVNNTPPVDLFGIEHQSRDGLISPGADGVRGTADDIALASRFNVDPQYIPTGAEMNTPDSYGVQSGQVPYAQPRGIGTLPGGIPLYKLNNKGVPTLVGGIGVFFPGPRGFASYEQSFRGNVGQTEEARLNAPRVLEAEWIAFAAAGGAPDIVPQTPGYDITAFTGPNVRIDLVGIRLEIFGPNPSQKFPNSGVDTLRNVGQQVGQGNPNSGQDQPVNLGGDLALAGENVAEGWLVKPHDAADASITKEDVIQIIQAGIREANLTRAAIRVDLNGPTPRTRMVFAVADKTGEVLGLWRMADATIFSIDVSVAKSRNTAYYSDPTALKDADKIDDDLLLDNYTAAFLRAQGAQLNGLGVADLYRNSAGTLPFNDSRGVALTNRTYRFLAEPRYPSGVDGSLPGIFSTLNDHNKPQTVGINPLTAENLGKRNAPASLFESVLGWDAFHIMSNFRDDQDLANQNGVVFFPGSTPLYSGTTLIGGFGVSGDGVDQDDVVTFAGQQGFAPPDGFRVDQTYYRGVRLPFQKFNRNPHG